MTTNKTSAYRESGILTADPITLTTMLFDGTLRAVKKARILHQDGNRDRYLDELQRASLILGELLASLDLEQGEIPKTLSGIYTYCIRLLTEAGLGDMKFLDEVEMHISRVATSWKAATAQLRATGGTPVSPLGS